MDDGSMSKSVVNWTQADVNDQFMAGKAAMMVNGPWQLPALNETGACTTASCTIPARRPAAPRSPRSAARSWTVPQTGDKATRQSPRRSSTA